MTVKVQNQSTAVVGSYYLTFRGQKFKLLIITEQKINFDRNSLSKIKLAVVKMQR